MLDQILNIQEIIKTKMQTIQIVSDELLEISFAKYNNEFIRFSNHPIKERLFIRNRFLNHIMERFSA